VTVKDAVEAIVREYAEMKPAVKKVQGYSFEVVDHLMDIEIAPYIKQPYRINVYHFRSLFRGVVVFFTLCWYADFTKLTDKEFQDCGSYIKITFLTQKNDQFGDNSVHVIPEKPEAAVCPVQFIRSYFLRFGLTFQGTGRPVNFRIRRDRGNLSSTKYRLSRSTATKYTRQL
jgi:hypothetical protein